MANISMQDELRSLREEVERLKQINHQDKVDELEVDSALDALVEGASELEDELESKAQEVLERMKLDYDNMSPATAVAIFSAGALFGRLFLSK
jgi:hypothetical protein